MTPQLAALAVHDLKNALGAPEGQLQALEVAPTRQDARRARQHCEQLRRELVAFLMLYRGERLCAMVEDESPREFLLSMQRAYARSGPMRRRVTLTVSDCAEAPAFWYFDARLVRLALDAALHNALRFATTQVVLSAAQRGHRLVLSVSDDGPGLEATTDMHDAWSTGLGTELCRAVARAHHNGETEGELKGSNAGEVRLFDRADGGACFELVLP